MPHGGLICLHPASIAFFGFREPVFSPGAQVSRTAQGGRVATSSGQHSHFFGWEHKRQMSLRKESKGDRILIPSATSLLAITNIYLLCVYMLIYTYRK